MHYSKKNIKTSSQVRGNQGLFKKLKKLLNLARAIIFRKEKTKIPAKSVLNVLDASAKQSRPSLHECPPLTPLISDIKVRFRTFGTVLMMDIEKRFLQISIDENGNDSTMYFQTILKSFAIDLQGSIFGVASSPFLVN